MVALGGGSPESSARDRASISLRGDRLRAPLQTRCEAARLPTANVSSWQPQAMRRLPLASVLLTAHALLLRIQSPADNACVPSTTAVVVEVLVEHDDPDDVAGQLRDAQICVEGSTDAGVVTRSCAVPGGGGAQ